MLTLRNDTHSIPYHSRSGSDNVPGRDKPGGQGRPMVQSGRSIEEEATFEGVGGLTIAYRSWRTTGPARGLVIIVPGFNSHSGYYRWAAEQLVPLGVSVYAVDLRGRGRSDGERFYVA